jgi:hypothetical protein
MADEDDKKPEDEETASQETAAGHSVVGEGGRETAVGHPVVESDSAAEAPTSAGGDEGTTEVFFSREEAAGAVAAGDAPEASGGSGQSAADVDPVAAAAVSQPEPSPQPASAPPRPPGESGGTSPAAADRAAADTTDAFDEKPELYIAGAFVGAFVIAKILKKLTGGGND